MSQSIFGSAQKVVAMLKAPAATLCTNRWVPQVRRVFVFAPKEKQTPRAPSFRLFSGERVGDLECRLTRI